MTPFDTLQAIHGGMSITLTIPDCLTAPSLTKPQKTALIGVATVGAALGVTVFFQILKTTLKLTAIGALATGAACIYFQYNPFQSTETEASAP